MKKFDALCVKLDGKNLVEASAGTGKTYAIGLMLLRLLLEKKISVIEILVVTFTNAAVAELDIRIRKFLNESLKIAQGHIQDPDKQLKKIVGQSIEFNGKDNTITLLKHALLHLDETSIFTIHSFCQNTLSENAFESRLLFNTEIMEDQSPLIELAAKDYWRKNITSLDIRILDLLIESKFSIELISDIFKKHLDGRKLRVLNAISPEKILDEIDRHKSKLENANNELLKAMIDNWHLLQQSKIGGTSLKKRIDEGLQQEAFEEFLVLYKKGPSAKAVSKLDFLHPYAEKVVEAEQCFVTFKTDVLVHFLKEATEQIGREVELRKRRNKVFSFQDLIDTMHTALVKTENPELKARLNKKYKAVFIDEFQDTDRLQFEIFKEAFIDNSNAILFLIGDPKQSIYAWRGADLHTYHEARQLPGMELYTMNMNYRSLPDFIKAVNEFFAKDIVIPGSQNSPQSGLNYIPVGGGNDKLGKVERNGKAVFPITIVDNHDPETGRSHAKNDVILSAAAQVIDLLENHSIHDDGAERKLIPQDIGVLVRSNEHAKLVKNALAKFGIPAIIVDDTKVIETTEADQLYHLLYAMLNIDTGSINRALMSSFTGYDHRDVARLNIDIHKDIFMKIRDTWKRSGIFAAISEFMDKYEVRSNLIFGNDPRGDRSYTNLIQLTQILNEKEVYEGMSPLRLLDWFQKARQGDRSVNKYEQQLESDEDSVKIATVHKSKGLQYNFVVLPYFNLTAGNKNADYIIYRGEDGYVISFHKQDHEKELLMQEEIEENRRLLYVAVTRAVYKCIIHHYNSNTVGPILNEYISGIKTDPEHIEFCSPYEIPVNYRYAKTISGQLEMKERQFNGRIDNLWRVTSYSGLYSGREKLKIRAEIPEKKSDTYDEFIFDKLPKGAQTGLLVHEMMENIEFDNTAHHSRMISYLLGKYGRSADEKEVANYKKMLENILEAQLPGAGKRLSQLKKDKRITELEFYFSFDRWNNAKVNQLLPGLELSGSDFSGVMNGFIDLVFEMEGKYYLLDWKTNHLGGELADYSAERITENISENAYQLQYMIYTLALKKYLEKKLPGFSYSDDFGGVIYAYVRGMRQGTSSGIFFDKPTEDVVRKLENLER